MKLELYNPSIFKDVFSCISHIIDECKVEYDNLGMKIRALDKSHITFVTIDFKYTLFDSYEVPYPETIIIDTDEFNKILRRCKNTDTLKMETSDGALEVTFEGDATKHYKIRLIDNDYETPELPLLEMPVTITVPSNIVKDSLADIKIFSEHLEIRVDEDYLTITGDGMKGSGEIKCLHGEHITEYVESKFSIEKLTDIFRCSKISETVKMNIGNAMPLTLTFELVSGDGEVSFLLAPRIESE